jgi:hypothetical protein
LKRASKGARIWLFIAAKGEVAMPECEFFYNDCRKEFSKILTRYDKEEMAWPQCGSNNVAQRWSRFSAGTSDNSA